MATGGPRIPKPQQLAPGAQLLADLCQCGPPSLAPTLRTLAGNFNKKRQDGKTLDNPLRIILMTALVEKLLELADSTIQAQAAGQFAEDWSHQPSYIATGINPRLEKQCPGGHNMWAWEKPPCQNL